MSLPLHVVDDLSQATPGATVEVRGDEAHHAVAVRRLEVGEPVRLSDGRGRGVRGTVAFTSKRLMAVLVEQVTDSAHPEPRVTVVQALPKGDRGELAVEVLTEVGVDTVVPWSAARCVAIWRGERATRSHAKWSATAREAAKQARRGWHPGVPPVESPGAVSTRTAGADRAVVLPEEATLPLARVGVPASGSLVVVVGPEGGITAAELAAFETAGAVPVRLGEEVLRTSTAGVVAVGALLARTPRWGS